MKLFKISLGSAFNSNSSDYITNEAVQRANALLTGNLEALRELSKEDVYTTYDVAPPTREQFSRVANTLSEY